MQIQLIKNTFQFWLHANTTTQTIHVGFKNHTTEQDRNHGTCCIQKSVLLNDKIPKQMKSTNYSKK